MDRLLLRTFVVASALLGFVVPISADQGPYGELTGLTLAKPEDKVDVEGTPPPNDAIVLFDGKNFENWRTVDGKNPAPWKLLDGGIMQAQKGNIISAEKFGGAFQLHVEFRVPYLPKASGQARGNSGVYVQGRYEVQVLDSYGLKSKDNDCGGIYSVAAPLVNACKAPTVWQSYDIDFESPECQDGKKTKQAVITVHHNGVLIHDKLAINKDNTTAGLGGDACTPGPIMLQDHGNPVQYRNIWLLPKK